MLPSGVSLPASARAARWVAFLRRRLVVDRPGLEFVPSFHVDADLRLPRGGRARRDPPAADQRAAAARQVADRLGRLSGLGVGDPAEVRFLYATYGIELATRDSVRTRRLVESAWYRQRYGSRVRLTDDQNAKTRFENDTRRRSARHQRRWRRHRRGRRHHRDRRPPQDRAGGLPGAAPGRPRLVRRHHQHSVERSPDRGDRDHRPAPPSRRPLRPPARPGRLAAPMPARRVRPRPPPPLPR